MCLIPSICSSVSIPVIAAGGIATGRGMLAAMALGADGVQIGSRFIATPESSAHQSFKEYVLASKEGDTKLTLKEITPVRLLNNSFYKEVVSAYDSGATAEELRELLGKGRAKKGMFQGDLMDGELEVGQVSAFINDIKPAQEVVNEIIKEFLEVKNSLSKTDYNI